jgi:cell filamentation protein
MEELRIQSMTGQFDTAHLQAVHHKIFQDVYAWAGEFRTVDIFKGGQLFGFTQHMPSCLNKTFEDLRKGAISAALIESILQIAGHTTWERSTLFTRFGRTQWEFMRQLALRNGFSLNWSRVSREQMMDASRQSFKTDNAFLERLLRNAVDNWQKPWAGPRRKSCNQNRQLTSNSASRQV